MKKHQEYAKVLGMDPHIFSTSLSQLRRSGKWGKKWVARFEILAQKLGKPVPEILSFLSLNNGKLIKIGPRTFTQKDFLKRQSEDEWCWKTIQESYPSHRWTLTLCLSPIFPLLKKIDAVKLWLEARDHSDEDLISILSELYLYAFEERMEFSWINPLLPQSIPVDIRIAAAKKANQEIARFTPEDLQKLVPVS